VNIVKIFCFTIESGGKVAVHCHAGYGRTGIAIACYLIYALNMGPMEAIKFIRSKRPGCVETKAQKKFVNDFYECKV
jgi:protein-tyrosine phosphatase